jgi:hypothetical protein
MDDRALPFKYRLAALLKLDQWEGKLLGAELRRARQVLEERKRLHRETLHVIAPVEAEMRALHQANEQIPLQKRQVLSDWLQQQYAVASTRAREVSNAEKLFEQILAQQQAKQLKIRGLEQHEDRERQQHDLEQNRAGLLAADELWLITRNGRK